MTATPETAALLVETCNVCDHQQTEHDPIGRRYCAATFANALTRRCICAMHTPSPSARRLSERQQ
jgi:hypothetical protein